MNKFHTCRKIIFATLVFLASASFAAAASFTDVASDDPHAAAIDFLSKEKIIDGYPDGSFRPDSSVNRAEALKILLLASDREIANPNVDVFPDVPANAWFAPFVFSAKNSAIVDGYLDGNFRPEQTVNLVEALKILLNTNSVELENYATDRQLFADSESRAWYNPFLFYAKTFALVDADSENKVHPGEPLTRGALAEIVYRFANRVENICPQFLQNTSTIPANYFPGVALDADLPRIFFENEIFPVRGILTSSAGSISAVIESRDDRTQSQFSAVPDGQNFSVAVAVGSPGSYNFSLIPSTTESNTAATLEVVPRECAPAMINSNSVAPSTIQNSVAKNKPTISWADSENNIFRIVLRQNSQRVEKIISGDQNSVALDPADFAEFEPGAATVQIFGAKSENGFSHEPRTQWSASAVANLTLGEHHFSHFDKTKVELDNLPIFREPQILISGRAKVPLENEAFLITPRGKVETISITDASEISAGSTFSFDLNLSEIGTYTLEINSTDGIAVLNHPLYFSAEFPLLPDFADLREPTDTSNISMNRERAIWLKLVNDFRAQNQLSKVELDDELSTFAQNYADQMAAQSFFGHTDPAGRDPDTRRKIFGLALPVGENLARDSATEYAHAGLLRSAAHRQNIVEPEWTRVGLGIARDLNGQLIFVQEFSADPLTDENRAEFKSQLLGLINSRRDDLGFSEFSIDGQLEPSAQNWSKKMVVENFTGFVASDDSSLENSVRATGYSGAFSSFIISAGRLAQIVEGLSEEVFTDVEKSRVAIGLVQNSDGRIIATLIFR